MSSWLPYYSEGDRASYTRAAIECNEGLTRILRELKSPLLDTFGLQMALKTHSKGKNKG